MCWLVIDMQVFIDLIRVENVNREGMNRDLNSLLDLATRLSFIKAELENENRLMRFIGKPTAVGSSGLSPQPLSLDMIEARQGCVADPVNYVNVFIISDWIDFHGNQYATIGC
ncbi:hypothetical protein CHS0354_031952 [Potamilus streckersoni]|uniref:Uncharacterized protein n=1 Tax=Potamilus streckersoni TaxID=2493646 RepID=A0AAE0S3J8_9BIVA|nr:hypothetical protein CHS0354_031952 [Potamilus streckersoni]